MVIWVEILIHFFFFNPFSFGRLNAFNARYILNVGNSFDMTFKWEKSKKIIFNWTLQRHDRMYMISLKNSRTTREIHTQLWVFQKSKKIFLKSFVLKIPTQTYFNELNYWFAFFLIQPICVNVCRVLTSREINYDEVSLHSQKHNLYRVHYLDTFLMW